MEEEHQLNRFNEIPLGLKIVGLFNMILGLFLISILFIPFLLGVILGYARYETFGSLGGLLLYVIIFRLLLALFYFTSFLLFFSSIDIFIGNSRAKKLIIISYPIIILSLAYRHFVYIDNITTLVCINYLILALFYIFSNHHAVKFFNNKGTKFNLVVPLSIVFLIYLVGFWIGKISFN